ncbi:MAG: tyrosine-type recombinase/integrase [Eubacterium sp.]
MKQKLKNYEKYLEEQELAPSTIQTYKLYATKFVRYIERQRITKKQVLDYRDLLFEEGYKVNTINLNIISVNRFLKYCKKEQCTVKMKKCQCRQSIENIITEKEYRALLTYARKTGRKKYYAIMKTLALTGIRISELQYITVSVLDKGYAQVNNKGKIREIYLPESLISILENFCYMENISEGVIFRGSKGNAITRVAVWKQLKYMADKVGIDREKVYPHSFRHFFAVSYMKHYSNIFELADLLGHSNLETTRIYLTESIEEKRKRIEKLDIKG